MDSGPNGFSALCRVVSVAERLTECTKQWLRRPGCQSIIPTAFFVRLNPYPIFMCSTTWSAVVYTIWKAGSPLVTPSLYSAVIGSAQVTGRSIVRCL